MSKGMLSSILGWARQSWLGPARHGKAPWRVAAGQAWRGKALSGGARSGKARQARRGEAESGEAWRGKAVKSVAHLSERRNSYPALQ